jgi:proline iminopeptidase
VEGGVNLKRVEGFVGVPGGKVWYIHIGESNNTPLLVLHGGPGSTHLALGSVLDALANERPVILYDQLGSGNSDRPTDSSLWQMERFIDELMCVREALQLEEVHLLGHSWGTMLVASYLLERKPLGVRSVIFSSPCLSADLWKKDADRLIEALPDELQRTIVLCEAHGTTD